MKPRQSHWCVQLSELRLLSVDTDGDANKCSTACSNVLDSVVVAAGAPPALRMQHNHSQSSCK
jgi:hypothetical protein